MPATSPIVVIPKRDLALCTIAPCSVAVGTGQWTVGTPISLLGYLDSVQITAEQAAMEAMSTESAFMNRIPTYTDASAQVIENQKVVTGTGASGGPTLSYVVQGFSYVQLQFAYVNGAHQDLITLYGIWSRYTNGLQGPGMQKLGISVDQADVSYASSGISPFSIVRT